MFTVNHTVINEIQVSPKQVRQLVKEYLEQVVLGDGCYVNKNLDIEHWTSYPHGSGTYSTISKATELQITADKLLNLLRKEDK